MTRRASRSTKSKLFVLDTNVLMHDPTSLFRFEEHDVFVSMMTLEELDNNKKGMSEVARNARQASRTLDGSVGGFEERIDRGIPLDGPSSRLASGRLFLQTEPIDGTLPSTLPTAKANNQIIGVMMHLTDKHPKREVILVSKDINMRIKARALGLDAQDYYNDKVLEDTDLLYPGTLELPADFWETHGHDMRSRKEDGRTLYRVGGPLCQTLLANQFLHLDAGQDKPFQSIVRENDGKMAVLSTLIDYGHAKNAVWGITARNREQNFALNLLMDPEIDFVTLLGQGHNRWQAASLRPPHLVAIFPVLASTNIYANWITMGGAFRLSFNYGWGVVRMPNRIMLPQYWHTEAFTPEELKYENILMHLPLTNG